MKQIIISVGREFGSGGHIVAQKLAEHYDIPIFNKELLEEMARKESKSCALPLGDSPLCKVARGIRTLGLQSHNLAR